MASRVTALLFLVVICIGFTAGEIAVDCCLSTTDRRLPRNILSSYVIQESGKGCVVSATVFITKKGKRLCAPESSQAKWVQDLITFLDKKRQTR
ncbi:eotaxin-like [Thunnus albacares]|uniref:eotaxin-like n=1 Tax=Thunnus albacares TaxID=8236 RepID=UPI001CF63C56|nr:eotaxin-like [Thunnus albacares]